MKRGLPVTLESVKGIQQAVFGPQLHQLLSALEEEIRIWTGQESGKAIPTTGAGEGKPMAPQVSAQIAGINTNIMASQDIDLTSTKLIGKGNGQVDGQPIDGETDSTGVVQTTRTAGIAEGSTEPATTLNVKGPEVLGNTPSAAAQAPRSEERRVGKECPV